MAKNEFEPRQVFVTGSVAFDFIADYPGDLTERVREVLAAGQKRVNLSLLAGRMERQFGGAAANIAYTLNLLKCKPLLLAAAGSDFPEYQNFWQDQGISSAHIAIYPDVLTSSYHVVSDSYGSQFGFFYVGASDHNHELSLIRMLRYIRSKKKPKSEHPDFVMVAPNTPHALIHFVRECRTLNLPYMYDPAFQIGMLSIKDLTDGVNGAQIVIGNETEIPLIARRMGISLESLYQRVPIVIMTSGSEGSMISANREIISVNPAKPKNTSDPTGAGDAYRAGFLAGYLRGFNPRICGQMGSVAAVYTVERYGTQTHHFTVPEFCRRYQDNYGKKLSL